MKKNEEIDIQKLWDYAFHGSPVIAAIALTILDYQLGGKISEIKEKVLKKEGESHGST